MKTPIIASGILLCLLVCCNEQPSQNQELAQQSKEKMMKATFQSLIDDGWNKGDMEKLRVISTDNYVRILNGTIVADNRNAVEANMDIFLTGFPDCKLTVDQTITKDDFLTALWTFAGTHTGIFGELPPTGKKVNLHGSSTVQFSEDGKIAREETYYNELELVQQLGYSLTPPILE